MKRFRLLAFYVAGVVAVICLAVWGVSLRRTSSATTGSGAVSFPHAKVASAPEYSEQGGGL